LSTNKSEMNNNSKSSKKSKILNLILLIAIFVVAATNKQLFFFNRDTARNFTRENHSNCITEDAPVKIHFTAGRGKLKYMFISFAENEQGENHSKIFLNLYRDGELIGSQTCTESQMLDGASVNIAPTKEVKKGDKITLVISSDAKDKDSAYRIPMGSDPESKIDYWEYSGFKDEKNIPGLHIVYQRLGYKTTLFYIAMLILAFAVKFVPRRENEKFGKTIGWLTFIISPAVCIYVIEMASFSNILSKVIPVIICNYLVILTIQLFFYALTLNTGTAAAVTVWLSLALAIINHYVIIFRGSGLLPGDLFVVGTALSVADSYIIKPDATVVISTLVILVMFLLASRYKQVYKGKYKVKIRAVPLVLSILISIFTGSGVRKKWTTTRYLNAGFQPFEAVKEYGMCYNFKREIRNIRLRKPEGYSKEKVRRATENYVEIPGTGLKPDVILIMNETLADFSMNTVLPINEDPLEYIHSFATDGNNRTYLGKVVSPSFGGGTANVECEALTGISIRNLNTSSIVYSTYINRPTYSLGEYFAGRGYDTLAMHCGNPKAYNRLNVYKYFGFDKRAFVNEYKYTDRYGTFVSDGSDYKEMLKRMDDMDNPSFVFNLTIQNHGAYLTDLPDVPYEEEIPDNYKDLRIYLGLLKESDDAFKDLIKELEKRDRPTLLIMWGDHLPQLSFETWDYLHMRDIIENSTIEKYTTPIVMWANYDADFSALPEIFSTNYLNTLVAHLAQTDTTGWHGYLDKMMESAPVYSVCGAYDGEGNKLPDEFFQTELVKNYKYIEYAIFRDRKETAPGFFGILD
jgi:phosphoglycerol transferase MdoB-like AlkP superfamily enzyme